MTPRHRRHRARPLHLPRARAPRRRPDLGRVGRRPRLDVLRRDPAGQAAASRHVDAAPPPHAYDRLRVGSGYSRMAQAVPRQGTLGSEGTFDREGRSRARHRNLAARAGRWSAAHWKTATFGWVAFVVVAVVIGTAVGIVKLTDSEQGTGETAQGAGDPRRAPASRRRPSESVLVRVDDAHAPTTRRSARRSQRVAAKLRTMPRGDEPALGLDRAIDLEGRHAELVQFDMKGKHRHGRSSACSRCSTPSRRCRRRTRASPSPSSASRARTRS